MKLTDTQLTLLTAAGGRKNLLLLPFPKSLKLVQGKAKTAIMPLIKNGLVEEREAPDKQSVWRTDEQVGNLTLVITAAGLEAIGMAASDEAPTTNTEPKSRLSKTKSSPTAAAPPALSNTGSKIASVVAAMRSKKGASIEELMELTKWQAHSVRGAISGAIKKKLSLTVTSEKVDGRGRVYRIAG